MRSDKRFKSFYSRLRFAKSAGVDPIILARAEMIAIDNNCPSAAEEFVDAFTSLEEGGSVPGFATNFGRLLETEEERELTRQLLKVRLTTASRAQSESIWIHLFRLDDSATVDSPEIHEFIATSLDAAAKRRLKSFKSRDKPFDLSDARAAIETAHAAFTKADSRFFLISGTLLGAIRDGGFIKNDYDIDLGIFSDEISLDEIKVLMKKTKWALVEDFEDKVAYKTDKGIIVDFFLCHRSEGVVRMTGWREVHNWYFTEFDLIEHDFLGTQTWIPDNYEKQLDENFGNWRSQTVYYDLSYDVPARVYGQNSRALNYLAKRMARSVHNNWRDWSTEPARLLYENFGVDLTKHFVDLGDDRLQLPNSSPSLRSGTVAIAGIFDTLDPHMIRAMESAVSLGRQVVLLVPTRDSVAALGFSISSNDDERRKLAETVRLTDGVYIVDGLRPEQLPPELASIMIERVWLEHEGIPEGPVGWMPFGPNDMSLAFDSTESMHTRSVPASEFARGSGGTPIEDRSAADWTAAAEAAAQQSDWRTAIRCRHRSFVIMLANRDVVATSPGFTASEIEDQVRESHPEMSETVRDATGLFKNTWYGTTAATEENHARFVALTEEILVATSGQSPFNDRLLEPAPR